MFIYSSPRCYELKDRIDLSSYRHLILLLFFQFLSWRMKMLHLEVSTFRNPNHCFLHTEEGTQCIMGYLSQ